jgi:hypothetical protein
VRLNCDFAGGYEVKAKYRLWCDEEIDQLKRLVASGASAVRTSVALKRSVVQIKKKGAGDWRPFPVRSRFTNEASAHPSKFRQ